MDEYLRANRKLWDGWTRLHVKSQFYDVKGFLAGRMTLDSIEREGVGDPAGNSLLHLQCHFGMDTLSWARLGARVTGVDFSEQAIQAARQLSRDAGLEAEFICSDIYDLPKVLSERYDIVFTSYGVLVWLPDLKPWAQVIAHFLKPGGIFYLVDNHPFALVFDNSNSATDLTVTENYFHAREPARYTGQGSYAEPEADFHGVSYEWQHSLGDVLNSLIAAGLQIELLHEYSTITWKMFPFMEQDEEGRWRLPERFKQIPLTFSVKASKPD